MKPLFDYTLLYRLMGEKHLSINKLSHKVGIAQTTLRRKLLNYNYFNQPEIIKLCNVLSIPSYQINPYFFDVKVQKTEQEARN